MVLAEAQQPRFKMDEHGLQVPDVRAEAAIIYNPENGAVLWESNSTDPRSIASITKVMTTVVFMEGKPDLAEMVTVTRDDVRAASTTHLRAGYKVTQGDLLHLTLIASDNAAARALARISPLGTTGFVERMNRKADELGLKSTNYVDTSGLLATNVSSAYDMAKLITYVSTDDRIASVMRKDHYSFSVGARTVSVTSTNQLLTRGNVDGNVQAAKTGFISKAGYCLATLLQLPQGGPQVAVVVLGAKSNAGRFWETRHLFNWVSSKAAELAHARRCRRPPSCSPPSNNLSCPIAALYGCRVQRQRRHSIHHRHDRALRPAGVIRLQIPQTDVARVHAVLTVRRGERRDARAIRVAAVRTGQRLELPPQRAATANQVTFRTRRDDREVGFPAAQRTVGMRP